MVNQRHVSALSKHVHCYTLGQTDARHFAPLDNTLIQTNRMTRLRILFYALYQQGVTIHSPLNPLAHARTIPSVIRIALFPGVAVVLELAPMLENTLPSWALHTPSYFTAVEDIKRIRWRRMRCFRRAFHAV